MIARFQLAPPDASGVAHAAFTGSEWLLECRLLELSGAPLEQRSADGESLLLVLSGTHDLYAGGGSWLRRGIRTEPFEGRPVAVFLPPATPFRLENGAGRAIVLAAVQPPRPAPATPKEALSQKPLLPIAGSGKSFDPATGTWKPREAFLASPEAILPRRIETLEVGVVAVQRVIGTDYKALGLGVDEVALANGQRVTPPPQAGGWQPREVGVYYEAEAELEIDGEAFAGRGVVRCAARPALAARGGRAYAALAYAGPKPTT